MKIFPRLITSLLLVSVIILIRVEAATAEPYITSNYFCLLDTANNQVIYARNADEPRPVASTTKIMTAILAAEYTQLDEIAVVTSKADRTAEYTIGLKEGQELTIAELLKVSLIKSANDAAVVLAEHVAGNERFFAYLMSKKAFIIGAVNTHFTNASGLPAAEHVSSAYDLAIMGRYLLGKEYINELVAAKTTKFKHPGYQQPLTISNTNGVLFSYAGANGIKTGTTNAAGKCLVASAKRDNRQLIAVVLHSANRNADAVHLLDYGFKEVQLNQVVNRETPFKIISVKNGKKDQLEVYPEENLYLWLGGGNIDIEKKVKTKYEIFAPVTNGQQIGVLDIYVNDKLIKSIKLVSRTAIDKISWIDIIKEITKDKKD